MISKIIIQYFTRKIWTCVIIQDQTIDLTIMLNHTAAYGNTTCMIALQFYLCNKDDRPRHSHRPRPSSFKSGGIEYDFYFFMDAELFIDLIKEISKCPKCYGTIDTRYDNKQMLGLCHKFTFQCEDCDWTKNVYTSKKINSNEGRGRKQYDVNRRAVIAFREIGKGFSAMETFCGFMNMPNPMSKTTYGDKSPLIHDAYLSVCQKSMSDASTEIRKQLQENFNSDALSDIDVSLDGSWQR